MTYHLCHIMDHIYPKKDPLAPVHMRVGDGTILRDKQYGPRGSILRTGPSGLQLGSPYVCGAVDATPLFTHNSIMVYPRKNAD